MVTRLSNCKQKESGAAMPPHSVEAFLKAAPLPRKPEPALSDQTGSKQDSPAARVTRHH